MAYAQVYPDLPKEIMEQARAQTAHRHRMEEKRLNAQIKHGGRVFAERRVGQFLAPLPIALCLAAGVIVILYGHDWAGSVIAGLAVALAGLYITGRRSKADDAEAKPSQTRPS